MAVSAAKILACLVDSKAAVDDDSEEMEEDEDEDDEPIPMDSKFNPKKGAHKTYWNTGNFTHTHTHTHTHIRIQSSSTLGKVLGVCMVNRSHKKMYTVFVDSPFTRTHVGRGCCGGHTADH